MQTQSQIMTNWFIRKAQKTFGPYSYDQVISLLQRKILFGFDLAANAQEKNWRRLREFNDFAIETIKKASKSNGSFLDRKHKRVNTHISCLVTNDKYMWKGHCESLSQQGGKMKITTPHFIPGNILTLHFHRFNGLKAFNLVCEIIGKELCSNLITQSSPTNYIVRFIKFGPYAEETIQQILEKEENHENLNNHK